MSANEKGPWSPEALQILDLMIKDSEDDLRCGIEQMTSEELAASIEDERKEATAEEFARYLKLVHEVTRKRQN